MSTGTASPASTAAPPRRPWWRPWEPLAALVVALVVLNAGAGLIDKTVEQPVDSWGYLFASIVITLMYAPVPLAVALALGLVGAIGERKPWTELAGAVVTALCGIAAVLAALSQATESDAGASQFAVVLLVTGAVLFVPPALALRRRG